MAVNNQATALSPDQALRFQLAGVEAEKDRTQAYLTQLSAVETELRHRLMTGTSATSAQAASAPRKTGTAKTAAKPNGQTRKRNLTKEARKKLSDSAKLRWARRRGEEPVAGENTTASAAAPVLQPPAGMQESITQ
jgi:ribosomal protein L12E/L44/L45/RPP1/RPP2